MNAMRPFGRIDAPENPRIPEDEGERFHHGLAFAEDAVHHETDRACLVTNRQGSRPAPARNRLEAAREPRVRNRPPAKVE
jgi:hypothetical protein